MRFSVNGTTTAIAATLLPLAALLGLNSAAVFGRPPAPTRASSPSKPAVSAISYQDEIAPIFKTECLTCHGADGAAGGLVLVNPETFFKGGAKLGAKIIVPGHSSQSGLIAYLRGANRPRMPFGKPALPADEISKLAAWIDQGAKIDPIKIRFPYAAPVAHQVPSVKNAAWCRNPIDNFVLARLEAQGLKPAQPASRTALMRRVYEDLVGVPPSPEEAATYLNDHTSTAYVKLVDRLLDDPRYGERWGRHWLDLVRFAETHGFERDGIRPRAWRYRDYVVQSFNADKPYDLFLKEQIAGDEMYPSNPQAIIATGFARLGPWDELSTDGKQRWQDYLNDVTDTTGAVVLGMTVGCARCHDHKYDRITQADYYRLQSFFASTKWSEVRLPSDPDPAPIKTRYDDMVKRRDDLNHQIDQQRADYRTKWTAAAPGGKLTDKDFDEAMKTDAHKVEREHLEDLIRQRDTLQNDMQPIEPIAEAIQDESAKGVQEHILLRGDLLQPGPAVDPGFVASLDGNKVVPATLVALKDSTGRRTALANWLASTDNPLTARVMVNRIWQHHFGRGIVATPSDFGINGQKPTHPVLLDWLALQFEQNGWSMKKMHRLMLLSSTYRQAADVSDPVTIKRDPDNLLFSRMNRIRLEGEALRDSILAVSGRLNPEQGGPSIYPHVSDEVLSTGSTHKWGASTPDQELRRTVYVFQRRSLMLPIVEAFDGADMSNTCPVRGCTTIAPQALALFNGEFSRTESAHFAERVAKEAGPNPATEIDRAYQIALCRLPTAAQRTQALAFLAKKEKLYATATKPITDPAKAQQAALADFCHVLVNVNEFLYMD